MPAITNSTRRVAAGIALLAVLGCGANYYFGPHLLGRFDKVALGASIALLYVIATYFRPESPTLLPERDSAVHSEQVIEQNGYEATVELGVGLELRYERPDLL